MRVVTIATLTAAVGIGSLVSAPPAIRENALGLAGVFRLLRIPFGGNLTESAAAAVTTSRRRSVVKPIDIPAPTAVADTYSVHRGATLTVTATSGVLVNDSDPNSRTLTALLVATTAHGTLTLSTTGAFTYVHDGSAANSDSFTYKASNGNAESNTVTVSIGITDVAPVAVDDTFPVTSAGLVAAPGVLANDTLNFSSIVSYGASTGREQTVLGISTATSHSGVVSLSADGSFNFAPAAGFSGSDSFVYVLQNSAGSSTATVTLNVQAATAPNDLFVTSPGFFYAFQGFDGDNPEITLARGQTYRFHINTDSIHPFQILNAPNGSVSNNNIHSGVITFNVPASPPTNMRYHCSVHDFGNAIHTQ